MISFKDRDGTNTMKINLSKSLQQSSFWLSLLIHIAIIFIFLLTFNQQIQQKEKPNLFVPAYLYHDKPAAASIVPSVMQKSVPASPTGILKKPQETRTVTSPTQLSHKSPANEAIHLIGDKKTAPKPLIKLLGTALTAKLIYPKTAVDFRLRGVAYIRFLIHPDGSITDIKLIKSSSADILDQAALDAVHAISPLIGVNQFLSESKYIIFGFVFG